MSVSNNEQLNASFRVETQGLRIPSIGTEEVLKENILKVAIQERDYKINSEVSRKKEVIDLTSLIEGNNNQILKLMEANSILSASRKNYVDEARKEYLINNPDNLNEELRKVQTSENYRFGITRGQTVTGTIDKFDTLSPSYFQERELISKKQNIFQRMLTKK